MQLQAKSSGSKSTVSKQNGTLRLVSNGGGAGDLTEQNKSASGAGGNGLANNIEDLSKKIKELEVINTEQAKALAVQSDQISALVNELKEERQRREAAEKTTISQLFAKVKAFFVSIANAIGETEAFSKAADYVVNTDTYKSAANAISDNPMLNKINAAITDLKSKYEVSARQIAIMALGLCSLVVLLLWRSIRKDKRKEHKKLADDFAKDFDDNTEAREDLKNDFTFSDDNFKLDDEEQLDDHKDLVDFDDDKADNIFSQNTELSSVDGDDIAYRDVHNIDDITTNEADDQDFINDYNDDRDDAVAAEFDKFDDDQDIAAEFDKFDDDHQDSIAESDKFDDKHSDNYTGSAQDAVSADVDADDKLPRFAGGDYDDSVEQDAERLANNPNAFDNIRDIPSFAGSNQAAAGTANKDKTNIAANPATDKKQKAKQDKASTEYDFSADDDGSVVKLNLSRAFIDMGDIDNAIKILKEVAEKGNEEQRQEANYLLDSLT